MPSSSLSNGSAHNDFFDNHLNSEIAKQLYLEFEGVMPVNLYSHLIEIAQSYPIAGLSKVDVVKFVSQTFEGFFLLMLEEEAPLPNAAQMLLTAVRQQQPTVDEHIVIQTVLVYIATGWINVHSVL